MEEQNKFLETKERFLSGKIINPNEFIILCKKTNISLPPEINKWINENMFGIKINGEYWYYNKQSAAISEYARELLSKLA